MFIPVDFRDADWPDTLQQAGCNLDGTRTHVLWEGVIYYLTDEGVATTLRAFRHPGVSLSLDVIDMDAARGEDADDPGSRQCARYSASVGEPIRFGIDFERMQEWAASHGWDVTDSLLTPEDISARFFPHPEPGHEPNGSEGSATMRPSSS